MPPASFAGMIGSGHQSRVCKFDLGMFIFLLEKYDHEFVAWCGLLLVPSSNSRVELDAEIFLSPLREPQWPKVCSSCLIASANKKNHGCLTRKPQETSLDSAMFRSFLDDEHEAWMWDDVGRSSQQGDESWNNISDLWRSLFDGTVFPLHPDLNP